MQDTAHAAGTLTAHQDGPLRSPPRAGSASLKGITSLERFRPARGLTPPRAVPPRSRAHSPSSGSRLARGYVPPSAGARHHACAGPRTRAFNSLTQAGRHHHAPGARAPVPPHQLPREEPIPTTVGRDCVVQPVSVP
jgi:hypothetical protein